MSSSYYALRVKRSPENATIADVRALHQGMRNKTFTNKRTSLPICRPHHKYNGQTVRCLSRVDKASQSKPFAVFRAWTRFLAKVRWVLPGQRSAACLIATHVITSSYLSFSLGPSLWHYYDDSFNRNFINKTITIVKCCKYYLLHCYIDL